MVGEKRKRLKLWRRIIKKKEVSLREIKVVSVRIRVRRLKFRIFSFVVYFCGKKLDIVY